MLTKQENNVGTHITFLSGSQVRAMALDPPPKAPAAEMAIALSVAILLDAVGTAKCALMSVQYDRGVRTEWRVWSARVESSLAFGHDFDASGGTPGVHPKLPGLRPGWLFGRAVDLSDNQWRGFRGNLSVLVTAALITSPLIYFSRKAFGAKRMPFVHAVYGVLVVTYLHGASIFWIAALIAAHFAVCQTSAGKNIGLTAIWASAIIQLALVQFTAHRWSGAGVLSYFRNVLPDALSRFLESSLDSAPTFSGILPRWWIHHNLLVLRLISYGVDLHHKRVTDSSNNGKGSMTEKQNKEVTTSESKKNEEPKQHASKVDYDSLVKSPSVDVSYSANEYIAYCLYPPLYLAGPTSVFNAFASQLRTPQVSYSKKQVVRYVLVKFLLILVLLEVWTHLIYTNAMAQSRVWITLNKMGTNFGPFEVGVTSLATLNFMWLKFAVIWRFFRCWSLLSGVEVPENMTRCVNNNSTILGFWKGWHASYNKWLVMYLYIPLGGAKYKLMNAWVVFLFVGAWHDRVSYRLFWWAVIFAGFLAPEIFVAQLGKKLFPSTESRSTLTFRVIRSFLGAVNVHVLITGNMVGYVVGMDGADELRKAYFGRGVFSAGKFLCASLIVCSAAAHVGFEQRAGEARVKGGGGGGRVVQGKHQCKEGKGGKGS